MWESEKRRITLNDYFAKKKKPINRVFIVINENRLYKNFIFISNCDKNSEQLKAIGEYCIIAKNENDEKVLLEVQSEEELEKIRARKEEAYGLEKIGGQA